MYLFDSAVRRHPHVARAYQGCQCHSVLPRNGPLTIIGFYGPHSEGISPFFVSIFIISVFSSYYWLLWILRWRYIPSSWVSLVYQCSVLHGNGSLIIICLYGFCGQGIDIPSLWVSLVYQYSVLPGNGSLIIICFYGFYGQGIYPFFLSIFIICSVLPGTAHLLLYGSMILHCRYVIFPSY